MEHTTQCEHCKQSFPHKQIAYRIDDYGYYNALCEACQQLPVFLPFMERLRRGLVTPEEIRNFNALHDM